MSQFQSQKHLDDYFHFEKLINDVYLDKNDNGRYQNWIAKELFLLESSALGFCHAGPNSETLNLYAKLYVELGRQISAYPV